MNKTTTFKRRMILRSLQALALAFVLITSISFFQRAEAQVNYSNNFNANATGWTGQF
ncbi:MAG: hypothetical protein IPL22_02710 [Bacteroidetes bacterium]|nr:hypothetical protein [Bacteroidota bacterium]